MVYMVDSFFRLTSTVGNLKCLYHDTRMVQRCLPAAVESMHKCQALIARGLHINNLLQDASGDCTSLDANRI